MTSQELASSLPVELGGQLKQGGYVGGEMQLDHGIARLHQPSKETGTVFQVLLQLRKYSPAQRTVHAVLWLLASASCALLTAAVSFRRHGSFNASFPDTYAFVNVVISYVVWVILCIHVGLGLCKVSVHHTSVLIVDAATAGLTLLSSALSAHVDVEIDEYREYTDKTVPFAFMFGIICLYLVHVGLIVLIIFDTLEAAKQSAPGQKQEEEATLHMPSCPAVVQQQAGLEDV